MACHISFRAVTYVPHEASVTITVHTDLPCHLWCRLSLEPPRIHKKSVTRRGEPFMSELRFCFTQYEDNEQEEAGDTYVHTFEKPAWPPCTTKYFYLYGYVSGTACPSTSPPFKYHNVYEPPPWIEYYEHVAALEDDCRMFLSSGVWKYSHTVAYGRIGWFNFSLYKAGCGFRFRNFPLSSTSTVLEAKLRHYANINGPSLDLKSTFSAEKSLDAAPFSTRLEWRGRPRFPDEVRCDDIPAWVIHNWYWTPDITDLITQIIAQPGWAPGGAIAIDWDDFPNESGDPVRAMREMEHFAPLTPDVCTYLYVKYIP